MKTKAIKESKSDTPKKGTRPHQSKRAFRFYTSALYPLLLFVAVYSEMVVQ